MKNHHKNSLIPSKILKDIDLQNSITLSLCGIVHSAAHSSPRCLPPTSNRSELQVLSSNLLSKGFTWLAEPEGESDN
ncbi:hypothetical protein BY996DRAFT_6474128 [Phakopsora pachyrhizi]|nr:hypothetical protein BY996DRAFT_6474128 [Phakopsora pachyrhizi]